MLVLDRLRDFSMNVPDTEELSGSGTKGNVSTSKVVDGGLGEHSVVLKLRLAQRGSVARDQDQLGYSDKKFQSIPYRVI